MLKTNLENCLQSLDSKTRKKKCKKKKKNINIAKLYLNKRRTQASQNTTHFKWNANWVNYYTVSRLAFKINSRAMLILEEIFEIQIKLW